jgi:hypothetical protein
MKIKHVWPVLFALIVVSGCFNIAKETPEKKQFVLEVTRPDGGSGQSSDAVLRVNEFQVSPQYEGRGFKYRKEELTLESDFYNEFFVRPGEMVAEQARQWLNKSGLFKGVVSGSTYIMGSDILEGTVQQLYGDYTGKVPEAVLELEFALLKEGNSEGAAFRKQYGRRIPAGWGPAALVKAWNQALFEILSEFEKDLESHMQG